jgi:hypothetical protein
MKHSINIRLNNSLHAILDMKKSPGGPNEYLDRISFDAVNGSGRLLLNF